MNSQWLSFVIGFTTTLTVGLLLIVLFIGEGDRRHTATAANTDFLNRLP